MDRLISRARVPLIWTIKITEGVMVSGDRSAIAELLDIAAQRERPSRDDLPWGNDERLRPCGCGDSGPATPYIGGSRATAPGIEHRGGGVSSKILGDRQDRADQQFAQRAQPAAGALDPFARVEHLCELGGRPSAGVHIGRCIVPVT